MTDGGGATAQGSKGETLDEAKYRASLSTVRFPFLQCSCMSCRAPNIAHCPVGIPCPLILHVESAASLMVQFLPPVHVGEPWWYCCCEQCRPLHKLLTAVLIEFRNTQTWIRKYVGTPPTALELFGPFYQDRTVTPTTAMHTDIKVHSGCVATYPKYKRTDMHIKDFVECQHQVDKYTALATALFPPQATSFLFFEVRPQDASVSFISSHIYRLYFRIFVFDVVRQ